MLVSGWTEVHGLRCGRTGTGCLPTWRPKVPMMIISLLTRSMENLARKVRSCLTHRVGD